MPERPTRMASYSSRQAIARSHGIKQREKEKLHDKNHGKSVHQLTKTISIEKSSGTCITIN
jgi:hypothetical protein